MNEGDVLILGSFWGGEDQKKSDFMLKLYEIRRLCHEFTTPEMNKFSGRFYLGILKYL